VSVLFRYYAILHKDFVHLWILVSSGGPGIYLLWILGDDHMCKAHTQSISYSEGYLGISYCCSKSLTIFYSFFVSPKCMNAFLKFLSFVTDQRFLFIYGGKDSEVLASSSSAPFHQFSWVEWCLGEPRELYLSSFFSFMCVRLLEGLISSIHAFVVCENLSLN
jgi:hypothetical protein